MDLPAESPKAVALVNLTAKPEMSPPKLLINLRLMVVNLKNAHQELANPRMLMMMMLPLPKHQASSLKAPWQQNPRLKLPCKVATVR